MPNVRDLRRFLLETHFPWQVSLTILKRQGTLDHHISPSAFGQALHPHCKTLEELFIAFNDGATFLSNSVMHDLKVVTVGLCVSGYQVSGDWSGFRGRSYPALFCI